MTQVQEGSCQLLRLSYIADVNELLIALLGAALATNQPVAISNVVKSATGMKVNLAASNDPVDKELREIMAADDQAQDEIERMIQENRKFEAQGAGLSETELKSKIKARFAQVRETYENFLKKHPDHAAARLAFGSFLNENGQEFEAVEQWEKSRELNPANPAAWNNLANYYGHRGPVTNAFKYYQKAIELAPGEPIYFQNMGTTVFLFRRDAKEFYNIDEQQVFDKALSLYKKAVELDPKNLELATDVAQTYYGIKPARTDEALQSWRYALGLTKTQEEKEGILLHMARVEIGAGLLAQAREHLDAVTNQFYTDLKRRLERNYEEKKSGVSSPKPETSADEKKKEPTDPVK